VSETNAALLVANHDERREREVLTALHDLGDAVDGDELIDELAISALFRRGITIAVIAARATAWAAWTTAWATWATASAATRTTTAWTARAAAWAI
jgi:hypothetical protein